MALWLISPTGTQLITALCFCYVIRQSPFHSRCAVASPGAQSHLRPPAPLSHTHPLLLRFLKRTSDRWRSDDTLTRNHPSHRRHQIPLCCRPVRRWNSAWCMNFIYRHLTVQWGFHSPRRRGASLINARGGMIEQRMRTQRYLCISSFRPRRS